MTGLKYFQNFTSTSIAQIIGLISQLLIIKILTTHLSLADFGLYSLILILPALFLPLVFSEIIAGFSRYFFEENKYLLYINAVFFLMVAFFTLLVILYPLKKFSSDILYNYNLFISWEVLGLALISHFFVYLNSLNSTFFKLAYKPKSILAQSLFMNIPKLILLIYFLANIDNKIYAIFLSFCLAHSFSFFVMAFPIFLKGQLQLSKRLLTKLLSYSVWMVPASYFGTIITSSDRLLIKSLSTISNVGIYSLGYKVGDFIRQFFIVSFGSVLGPIKFNHNLPPEDYQTKMNELLLIFVGFGFGGALIINALANPILLIISTKEFIAANLVIPFILVSHLIWGLNDFLNTGYLLQDKSRITSLLLFVGATVNISLNLFLIPKVGLIGACLATALSYLCILPFSNHYSKKHHELRLKIKPLLKITLLFLTLISIQTLINFQNKNMFLICFLNLSFVFIFATIFFLSIEKSYKVRITSFIKKILKNFNLR